MTRQGRVYYPKSYNVFKADSAKALPGALMKAGLHKRLIGPLLVSVWLYVTRPKSTKLEFPKPDVDNYVKSVLDACNGLAWEDDYQVAGLVVEKAWAKPSEEGFIQINVKGIA